jgi:hypothetical protein
MPYFFMVEKKYVDFLGLANSFCLHAVSLRQAKDKNGW